MKNNHPSHEYLSYLYLQETKNPGLLRSAAYGLELLFRGFPYIWTFANFVLKKTLEILQHPEFESPQIFEMLIPIIEGLAEDGSLEEDLTVLTHRLLQLSKDSQTPDDLKCATIELLYRIETQESLGLLLDYYPTVGIVLQVELLAIFKSCLSDYSVEDQQQLIRLVCNQHNDNPGWFDRTLEVILEFVSHAEDREIVLEVLPEIFDFFQGAIAYYPNYAEISSVLM